MTDQDISWRFGDDHHAVQVPDPIIIGTIEDFKYVYNPRGRTGVVVLGQPAADVFQVVQTGGSIADCCARHGLTHRKWLQISDSLVETGVLERRNNSEAEGPTKSRRAYVWLQVTDSCNLACTYCYISKEPKHMSLETARSVLKRVHGDAKEMGYEGVVVKLAGGEPALNWNVCSDLMDWADAEFGADGIDIRFGLLTNGTVLPSAMLETLVRRRMPPSVSIDGIGTTHDRQRPLRAGGGSFRLVDQNITRLIDSGLKPYILVTVTAGNCGSLKEISQYCFERALRFRFSLARQRSASVATRKEENSILSRNLLELYEWMSNNLPSENLHYAHRLGFIDLMKPRRQVCGVGSSSVTISVDGKVSLCQQYDMCNPVGSISDGNVLVQVELAKVARIPHTSVDEIIECRECKWRLTCAGGCPYARLEEFGHGNSRSPHCDVYRQVLPVLIRMHAKQLIEDASSR